MSELPESQVWLFCFVLELESTDGFDACRGDVHREAAFIGPITLAIDFTQVTRLYSIREKDLNFSRMTL